MIPDSVIRLCFGVAQFAQVRLAALRSQAIVAVSVWSVCSVVTIAAPQRADAQQAQSVVLIVTDGYRWQEFFGGADSVLISRRMGGVGDTAGMRREFWRPNAAARRRIVMPFLWDSVATQGTVFGSPDVGGIAHVTNGLKFSYPGYSEMLVGRADPRIDSNDFGPNPNVTVFEWLSRKPAYAGKVSAFATWDAFPRIFNVERAGHLVYAGWNVPSVATVGTPDPGFDRLVATTIRYWDDNIFDSFTQAAVLNHVKARKPRVLFVGYGETDEWAHGRRYDLYLRSAQAVDRYIAELWHTMQAMPEYRGKVAFVITTDHGRGDGNRWTDHGKDVDGADRIWIAMFGAGVSARGMVSGEVTQAQIAATVAALLGEDFSASAPRPAAPLPLRP